MDTTPLYITQIEVRKLFGLYDYILGETNPGDQAGRVAILYGDNGSGKTTILRSIFHILAPDDKSGHKTEILKIPFSFFKITFNNKLTIQVERDGEDLIGSYTLTIKRYRKSAESFHFIANEDMAITAKSQTKEEREENALCLSKLKELNLGLYYLADDRTISLAGRASIFSNTSNFSSGDNLEHEYELAHKQLSMRSSKSRTLRPGAIAAILLEQSMQRFALWTKNLALQASSAGDSSVNSLYLDILGRIARVSPKTLEKSLNKEQLQDRIFSVENRSQELSQYGFVPEFKGKDLLAQLDNAKAPQNISMVSNVLAPYLDGLEKRLETLNHTYEIVNNLVQLVNGFMSNKLISFDIHNGLSITTTNGRMLSPSMLSSGERHLLLIFCNTAISLDHPSIFIVDEPEISLNIKWQRLLIASLSKCIGNNPVQYLFATHSLEIISQYRDRLFKLEDLSISTTDNV